MMSSKANSLADFCKIETENPDGTLVYKDGSLGCVFELRGIDASFFDLPLWNSLYESWRSLLKLEAKESLQFCFSKRADFEGLIEKKFAEIELVQNSYTKKLFLQNLNSLLGELNLENPALFTTKIVCCYSTGKPMKKKDETKFTGERVFNIVRAFEYKGLRPKILKGRELWKTLTAFASGISYASSEKVSEEWPSIQISPHEIAIEDRVFRALTLTQLPEAFSEMGMMLALTRLPFPFDLCVRFTGRDPQPLRKRFERKRRILFGMLRGKASGDVNWEAQYKQIEDVLRRLTDLNDTLLDMRIIIGFRAKRENQILIRRAITEVLNSQSRLGHLEFQESSLSTFDCYLETIPSFEGKLFDDETLLASNGVHFLPLYAAETGDPRAVACYRTRTGEVFSINPIDDQLANFNWLVSGTSGSGKSFFINSLLAQSMSLNPRIFIVDIGGSYQKLVQFLGGESIGLDVKQGFKLGPFFMERSSDPAEEKRRREHIQMIFWEMLRDENKLPSVEERGFLHEVLEHFLDLEELPEHPIKAIKEELDKRFHHQTLRLRLLLDRWAYPSFFGDFLDNPLPLKNENQILNFDLKGLSEFEDLGRVVQLILCSNLWSRIRKDSSRFTFIILDEVAFSLLRFEPQFVDELVSTARKYNAGVVLIAQDLEKITANSAGASILQNTQIKAILQQRGDPKNFAEPLGLVEPELSAIRSLDRRKGSFSDIFLMIDHRRTVIRFVPNALEYYLGTSAPQENRMLQEKLAKFPGTYQEKMLRFVEETLQ